MDLHSPTRLESLATGRVGTGDELTRIERVIEPPANNWPSDISLPDGYSPTFQGYHYFGLVLGDPDRGLLKW